MADEVTIAIDTAFRDFVTEGVPSSGRNKVKKSEVRSAGVVIQEQLDAVRSLAISTTQWKDPVDLATTGNVTLSGEQTIDSALTSATEILVKDQSDGDENGIYTTGAGAWTRRADANEAAELVGMAVFVRTGAVNGGKQFVCQTPSPIVVGTTALVFAEISDQSALNATLSEKADRTEVDALEVVVEGKVETTLFNEVYGDALLDVDFAESWGDEDGGLFGGFRHDGVVEWANSWPMLDTKFKYAVLNSSMQVLWGITHDDTFWSHGLGSGDGGSATDDGTTMVMSRDGQIIVDRADIRSPITFSDYNENPSVVGDFVSYMADTGSALVSRTEEVLCSTSLSGSVSAVRHYLMYGQSLSEGSESKPALHTSAVRPGRAVMFNAGTRPRGSGSGVQEVPAPNEYAWVDALEAEQESPALAVSWGMTESGRLEATEAALVSAHGVGGRTYAELKQGTQPYENLKEAVRRARVIAARNGIDYSLEAVSWIHGEANRLDAKETYKAYMVELQADLTEDLNNLTDQTGEVLLALDQMSNFTAYNLTASEVPVAQLEVALENPTKMICVGPKYILPTVADGIHLTAASSAVLGSYHARAIDQLRKWMGGAGDPWKPLYCTGAVRVGALVTLTMHVPVGALTLDTATVSNPGNYGITWDQTGGTARTISSVAVVGNTIEVTLSGDPGSPTLETIGIAAVGVSGNDAGPTTGARSNFRDQATETDIDGNIMRNWACHQLITL